MSQRNNYSNLVFALLILGFTIGLRVSYAQEAAPDSAHAWHESILFEIAGNQAGFDNWVEGGTNSLSGRASLLGIFRRQTARWTQLYEFRFKYGLIKQDQEELRKAEDEIYLLAAWGLEEEHSLSTIHPTAGMLFRSQFYEGINYEKNPFDEEGEVPVKVSDFLAPATFQQTVGFSWTPKPWFSQHLGVGSKQTFVRIEELRELYGNKADEFVRIEVGVDAITRMDIPVAENIQYITQLGLFAAFNTKEKPDTRWDNELALRVNGWLRVVLEWVVQFDADVSKDPQIRQTFGVGITYALVK